jgi:ADP-L-glycero-D-manno-heptose 6-epimerase
MARPIVVTGAAGFIGRNVVAELNRRGEDEIILVDELGKDDKWKNLVGLRYEDIVSPEEFLGMLEEGSFADARSVIHMGACSSTTEKDADYLLRNNYQYTRVLANWCESHEVRFVYASSAATYGDGSEGYNDDDAVTPELRPLNMYGYSKQMFDVWAIKQGLLSSIVGLKFFNVYGSHEDHKGDMRSMAAKSYDQIRCNGFVRLFKSHKPEYKDGEQRRDFVWIGDAVDVVLHFAAQEYGAPGGLFNCGTGRARTWLDLANAVFHAMDKESHIQFMDMPDALRGKYQYFTEAATEKLRRAGYTRAFTSLEDGVAEYVRGYLTKRAG